jgi:hypothetical protein
MDTRATFRRITLYVVAASALLTALSFALGGLTMGIAAAVGGALAVGNWMSMRWVGRRLVVANDKGRMVWGGLLAVKMLALMLIAWGILATGVVDPMGFTIGLGGLVLGILAGAFHTATVADPVVAAEPSSEES